jgi:hypothetical protein
MKIMLGPDTPFPYRQLWPLASRPDNRLGLSAISSPEVVTKFSGLQIRKLDAAPN